MSYLIRTTPGPSHRYLVGCLSNLRLKPSREAGKFWPASKVEVTLAEARVWWPTLQFEAIEATLSKVD